MKFESLTILPGNSKAGEPEHFAHMADLNEAGSRREPKTASDEKDDENVGPEDVVDRTDNAAEKIQLRIPP